MKKLMFYISLAFACLIRGYLKRYRLLLAQAVFETGSFSSNIFNEKNNAFGMKVPNIRKFYGSSDGSGWAVYSNYLNCCLDRIEWDKYRELVFMDNEGYIEAVTYYYSPDSGYENIWKSTASGSNIQSLVLFGFVGLLIVISGLLYLVYLLLKKVKLV
jgi:hypothetical protein